MRHVLILIALTYLGCSPAPEAGGRLPQHVYVWQLVHDDAVSAAVRQRAPHFARTIVLAAEMRGTKTVHADIDWIALPKHPIGLALRIDKSLTGVAALAEDVMDRTGPRVVELQIDYDCPDRRLSDYIATLRRVRARIDDDVALTITALPSWLDQPDVGELMAAVDGYVLQAHSLERPASERDLRPLLDVQRTRRWIARAAELGRPFRLALPSYGYLMVFDAAGNFDGLVAEQRLPNIAGEARVRRVMANAPAMAELVRELNHSHPQALQAIVWFRLPVDGDRASWSWPALRAVSDGEPVAAKLRALVDGGALVDVVVHNDGAADATQLPARVTLHHSGRVVHVDAVDGFSIDTRAPGRVVWRRSESAIAQLPAGARRAVGHVRFMEEGAVHATVDP